MEESKLKMQLARITAITIVSSILLVVIGIGILMYIMRVAHDVEHMQMQAEADEYKVRILKQMDANVQILSTLAKEYEVSGIIHDPEMLERSIQETNTANDFVSLAYVDTDGTSVFNAADVGTWTGINFEDWNPLACEAVKEALTGKNSVSKMFDSQVYNGMVFMYAVPVYEDGKVVGALAAGDTLEIFTDIANGNTVLGGSGYVHLINEDGEFLVRSQNTLVKEPMTTIFDGPFLSDDTKESTMEALKRGDNVFGEFTYEGNSCHFYCAYLGLNGWYLFCANRVCDSLWYVKNIVAVAGGVTLLLVIMVNVLLYIGYNAFRKNTKSLIRIAYWDPLTGAENTIRFDQNYQELMERETEYSTVALDVHNFKGINDLFGKEHGDHVLQYLKRVIEDHLHQGEFFCRDTADLFYIVMLETDEFTLSKRLRSIIDMASKDSLEYGEYSFDLSLYAGVAVKEHREKALLALQSIQHTHHMDIAFYNQALYDEVRRKNSIESQMYPALQNTEFQLFLQPKMDLKTNTLVGAEALVRWKKSDGSYYYPNEFIPLFESNGFCLKLDMYMVERMCEQIRAWIDQGMTPIPISVNQSKLLFSDLNYPENLDGILKKHQIPPSLITLEILEGVATDNLTHLNRQIGALHAKGFRISMDDFGSGYSSLNMLYQLKIDELKLDRGFLRESSAEDRQRSEIILEQIVEFSKKLGIITVAEGIENQEDENTVMAVGCDYGQGYFYDKPMDAYQFSQKYMKKIRLSIQEAPTFVRRSFLLL